MKKTIPIGLLIFFSGLSLFVGVQSISITHLFQFSDLEQLVFWNTRIPRTASLIIAGATSSVCGLIMQHLTQNKFVSPTTAGTMDSARLGMLVAMLFFPASSILTRSFIAFIFAFLGTYLFIQLIKKIPGKNQIMIPLVGVMFGNIIGSVVTFFAYQFQLIQNMTSWLQGNFATVTKGDYELIYVSVPILIICYFFAYKFTIVGMGEDIAVNVGLNYERTQMLGLLLVAVASSVTLVTIGGLPFLGVIIPNIVSQFYGDQMKQTLWITAVSGSLFLVMCDILSRVIRQPYEVPVSLIVGVIGSIIFIVLLVKGAKE
ncbi:iron chelate uptake ABC transporter family permease subunit [Vagococcus carniphilus]|uniref:Iron chelate uptake ABC transporter family permease subunit n=1 Tax=Vagococcus carniphilus TaxID=218144 RepID=A0AAW8U6Q3_9ENTE|nr:iron chelate uptake ABC transporter family permease subunit [Vagococcus carniphilus]MDT2813412.1 iron chelate uptake ABC transporter family permease subunit [Vagococcus carniphilus]MDT2830134.1 iron chelate uptake ABC transporter family permease subunit [Vagococcus carniphilus]MDT2833820.1 iron chelate uptake ABC transporter family permease subunit [Vagococcus carniphilus]MDT2838566.1 iron chelate uptake ABC transporter family permease subunit [Vagococcus carniphilus]MDT2848168.1 iron chela